ncbi:magnesium transporter [Chitinivorax sp. B]|uniref:magnesium transporter n=1 Tax=Chitinivorax sp. B TaxID=2502235 RepID=UPI0010F71B1C|nr:magnesium transporter [Chitinivorax sp. B]
MNANEQKPQESLQESLQQVQRLIARHKLVEGLVHKQDMPKHDLVETLVHRQNLVELQQKLEQLHPADIAHILEALPVDERLLVWDMVKADRDGDILLEVSDAVRETLLAHMDSDEILAAAEQLDADEIADLAPDLPQAIVHELMDSLDKEEREQVQSALSYDEHQVGGMMDFEMVTIRDDVTLEVVLRYLRRFDELPNHTDKLFVVDKAEKLKGILPIKRLLVNDPDKSVAEIMAQDMVTFHPEEDAGDAAQAFERYDLISAPVIDRGGKLIGRLTVDMMVDVIREETENEMLNLAGLREDEDLFSSVWASAKNRWPWLAINICTAFVASRVIGAFENTISSLVALSTLMTIVAGIGGNTGNQTSTLIIRGLALNQINASNARRLIIKELGIALLNGLVWGSVMGFIAWLLYKQVSLGLVMMAAMVLNFQVAALVGIFVPLTMHKMGRDPAFGSSVLLTATTDSMGFFIFLGLATAFLL